MVKVGLVHEQCYNPGLKRDHVFMVMIELGCN